MCAASKTDFPHPGPAGGYTLDYRVGSTNRQGNSVSVVRAIRTGQPAKNTVQYDENIMVSIFSSIQTMSLTYYSQNADESNR